MPGHSAQPQHTSIGPLWRILIPLLFLTPMVSWGQVPVVISQVYGGGGNSGAVYTNDFIELHNFSGATVALTGYSVQYAAAGSASWAVVSLSGSIPAGGYYLVQAAAGAGGTTALPASDATGTINLNATEGKVALVAASTALAVACPTAGIVDFVGYGSMTTCFEGSGPAPATSNTTNATLRNNGGCTDTNNNSTDFAVATANPRNTAAPANLCASTIIVSLGTLVFTTPQGTPSAEQSYAVAGTNLSAPITAVAPVGYQLTTTSNNYAGATNTLQLPAMGGNVYVRLSGATAGIYNGSITHTSGSAAASKGVQGTVMAPPPSPTITSFSPPSGIVGTTVTINGTNFNSGATVRFNGTAASTVSFVNAGQLTAVVPAGATTGLITVTVGSNTASSSTSFVVDNPAPAITSLAPNTAVAGSGAFTLAVNGTGFVAGSMVSFNGTSRTTTYISATQLTAAIPAADVATAGTYPVTVITPAPGGGTSGTALFTVTAPAATPLLAYSFAGNPPAAAPSLQNPNVTGTSFTRATGLNAGAAGDRYTTTGWPLMPGVDLTKYVQFNFAPNTAYQATLTSLSFVNQRSAMGPTEFQVRSSADAYATILATGTISGITANPATVVMLSGPGFTGIPAGAGVTFRFYAAGASNGAGVYSLDDVQLFGTVSAAPVGPLISVVQNEGGGAASTAVAANSIFGFPATALGSSSAATFYIKNTGSAPLTFLNAAVEFSGTPSADFSITQPLTASVAAGDSVSFVITFRPTSTTLQTATITIDSNDAARSPYNFTVTGQSAPTARTIRWDGGGATTSWFDAANWAGDMLPAATDNVLLDHRFVSAAYTVSLGATSTQATVRSLSVKPGTGPVIEFLIPATNTAATALQLTNAAIGDTALAIYSGGLVRNASGAGAGSLGIDAVGANATVYVLSGGTYRHETPRAHASLVENLAGGAATAAGNFVFATSTPVGGSTTVSVAAPYGNLTFADGTGGGFTYNLAGAATVRGNLTIDAAVNTVTTNSLTLGGNLTTNGTLRFNASTARTLLLNGTGPQSVSGARPLGVVSATTSYLNSLVTLEINNPAGVVLNAPVLVNGTLLLTNGLLASTTANLLTLANNASGGSSTSFVTGPVAREVAAAGFVQFPIGRNTTYRPLTLNVTAQAAGPIVYTAEQQDGPTPQVFAGSPTPVLTQVSNVRRYTVTSSNEANFSGTITLSYGPDDGVTNPASLALVIGRNGRNGWENIGRTPTSNDAASITSGPFTTFNDFALASTTSVANPLPVTLVSFTAERQPMGVQLRWTTATEKNNALFEVQRAADGRSFQTIATVQGQGQSTRPHYYATLDPRPGAGVTYYRLRQLDFDGSATFSAVVAVAASQELTLFPNPTTGKLTIQLPPASAASIPQIRITDLAGRTVQAQALPALNEIDLSDLPAGIYVVSIRFGDQQATRRIVKE